MARDSSGNHTLPAGNPVVTGTPVSSTTHNNTLADLSSELTDSLSRSGKGGMSAALKLADGTVGAPALTFTSDADSGLYRVGANNVAISVNGVKTLEVKTTGVETAVGLTVTAGSGVEVSADSGLNAVTGLAPAGGGTGVLGHADVGTNGHGVRGNGDGTGAGGSFTGGASSPSLIAGNNFGQTRAPLRIATYASAPTVAVVGDIYVSTAGVLFICTNATGPVWTKVGTQT